MKRFVVTLFVLWTASLAWGSSIQYVWLGGTGTWDGANNWSPTGPPTITAYGDVVTAYTSGTITVRESGMTGMGPAVNVLNNSGVISLVKEGTGGNVPTLIVTSSLINSNQINITDGFLEVGNNVNVPPWMDPVTGITASGGGTINLTGGRLLITSPLTLSAQTIQGNGSGIVTCNGLAGLCLITAGSMMQANGGGLVVSGATIDATGSVLQAVNGGTLQLGGGHWSYGATNVNGGAIQAQNGSTVLLGYTNPGDYDAAGAITGSILSTVGSGVIQASEGMVLNGITNQGNLQVVTVPGVLQGNNAVLANTINNTGTITLASGNLGLNLQMFVPGAATLTGGGTVNMGGYNISGYTPNGAPGTLTNAANLIQGAGSITAIVLNNQSMIDANTSGGTLMINDATVNNTGTLQASNGGTLQLGGGAATSVSGGVIQALGGSTVMMSNGVTINGSTLNTSDTGQINAGAAVLNGITNNGNLRVVGPGTTVLANTINNTGAITLAGGNIGLNLQMFVPGNATLTGGGTVNMGGGSISGYTPNGAPGTLTTDNHIQGAGSLSAIVLNNQAGGVIDANTGGQTLAIYDATVNNTGTLQASNGGTLQLGGGATTSVNGGLIQALNGSTVALSGGLTVTGSTLNTSDTGQIDAGPVVLNGIANLGNLRTVGGGNTVLAGTIDNVGTITMAGGNIGLNLQMFVPGSATLTGGGTINMAGGLIDGYTPNGAPGSLTNIDNTIQGSGNITAHLTNLGTVRAGAGEVLSIGDLANYSGGTLTGGTYDMVGIIGIAGPIVNNAATIILDGTSSSLVYGAIDALASTFIDNRAGGTFELLNGRNFTTAGDLSNEGAIDVGAGSTLDVTGTFNNTGSLNVSGTLVAGTVDVGSGQQLKGSGIIDGNVVVSGETDPGNSPGTLTINGNFTQTMGSFMNIELGGPGLGQFDQLNVNGDISLAGTLAILLYGGYAPAGGTTFDILNWTGVRTGSFDAITFPTLASGYSFLSLWGDKSLTLEVLYQGGGNTVPEPATYFLIAAGLLVGGYQWRKMRRTR
ncbi:MAG: hypothetical protein LAP87_05230 [Acidobacteriia bacterium]|nr:hypothetical protein [Terriglobia bacterium]